MIKARPCCVSSSQVSWEEYNTETVCFCQMMMMICIVLRRGPNIFVWQYVRGRVDLCTNNKLQSQGRSLLILLKMSNSTIRCNEHLLGRSLIFCSSRFFEDFVAARLSQLQEEVKHLKLANSDLQKAEIQRTLQILMCFKNESIEENQLKKSRKIRFGGLGLRIVLSRRTLTGSRASYRKCVQSGIGTVRLSRRGIWLEKTQLMTVTSLSMNFEQWWKTNETHEFIGSYSWYRTGATVDIEQMPFNRFTIQQSCLAVNWNNLLQCAWNLQAKQLEGSDSLKGISCIWCWWLWK